MPKEATIITAKVQLTNDEVVMVNNIADKYAILFYKYMDKVRKDRYDFYDYNYILDENKLDIDKNIIYAMIDHIKDVESSQPSMTNKLIKTFRTKNIRVDYDQCIINDIIFSLPPLIEENTKKKLNYATQICYIERAKLMLYKNELILKIDTKDLRIRNKGAHG